MISEREIKNLRRHTSKRMMLLNISLFGLFMSVLLVCGAHELYEASRLAHEEVLSLSQVIRDWHSGVSSTKQYSGVHILALSHWEYSLILLLVSVFIGCQFFTGFYIRRRNLQLLELLDKPHAPNPALQPTATRAYVAGDRG